MLFFAVLLFQTCIFSINPDIFKNLELLLYSHISKSDNTEVVEWCVWRPN